jgi:catechol 2,3-dioxygenase-like lactoylglutathione lyase family enzyme
MRIEILGMGDVRSRLGTKPVSLGHEVKTGSRSASNPKASERAKADGSKDVQPLDHVKANPFKRLVYVYIGTSEYDRDREFYERKLGAALLWEFQKFGARVAAFDLCGEPYLLIADHVKAPSKRLIYEVEDLEAAAGTLRSQGWESEGGSFEVPDGPCMNFKDASGNEYAILEMSRPHILEKEFRRSGGKSDPLS